MQLTIFVSVFCVSLILGSDLQGAKRTCSHGTKKLVTDTDQVKPLLTQLTKTERMLGGEEVENTRTEYNGGGLAWLFSLRVLD